MTLSDAMRLGAMATAPTTGRMFHRRDGGIVGACALGAACLASGMDQDVSAARVRERFPVVGVIAVSPLTGARARVVDVILALNDLDGWTRERIADWVASIEATWEDVHAVDAETLHA